MSVVINTNSAATIASNNLSASNAMLQRSLNRLSSGSKIVNASDDAGGVAVASRLSAAAKRASVSNANIGNAVSFLQNQDSALKTIGKMLERMSELQSLYKDATKNTEDTAHYTTEFDALGAQIDAMAQVKFNNKALLDNTSDLDVTIDEKGGTFTLSDPSGNIPTASSFAIDINASEEYSISTGAVTGKALTGTSSAITATGSIDINGAAIEVVASDTVATFIDKINASSANVFAELDTNGSIVLTSKDSGSTAISVGTGAAASTLKTELFGSPVDSVGATNDISEAIQDIAAARANNGSDQSILGYYAEMNSANKANYESAISKILDVDVAEESTQLARWNTLVQAGTAMVAQANGTTQNVLTLLR